MQECVRHDQVSRPAGMNSVLAAETIIWTVFEPALCALPTNIGQKTSAKSVFSFLAISIPILRNWQRFEFKSSIVALASLDQIGFLPMQPGEPCTTRTPWALKASTIAVELSRYVFPILSSYGRYPWSFIP